MLLNLYFENFRSFKDPINLSLVAEASKAKEQNVFVQRVNKGVQEEEERLLKSAVIYGANASGKSNLIRGVQDILAFVCDFRIAADELITPYTPFLFDTTTNKAPVKFAVDFLGKENVKFKYEISFNLESVLTESLTWWPQGKPVVLLERVSEGTHEGLIHKIKFRSHQKNQELDVFRNQAALSKFGSQEADEIISSVFIYFNRIEIVTPLHLSNSRVARNDISEKLYSDGVLMKRMNELLRFADTGLKSVSVAKESSDRERVILDRKGLIRTKFIYDISGAHTLFKDGVSLKEDASLSFAEESNGVKTLYTFGGKILGTLQDGGIIFVDELETSLHPYLSKLLVLLFQNERINKKNAQLIFTTHDTNLLERNIFRRDQIWFAQKNEFGVTDLYSLQDFPDVREDTPFDKWYLAGKFGGIPDIKSLEALFEDI
jgi:AAA15 family ATPase/GTPase